LNQNSDDENRNYNKSYVGKNRKLKGRTYHLPTLANSISVNNDVIMLYHKITEKEFETVIENIEEIVDHIEQEKKIDRKNIEEYGRLYRIVYFEYIRFIPRVLKNEPHIATSSNYKINRRRIVKTRESSKEDIFCKYMNIYAQYEKTFPKGK
jgi:hypothetical protein